MSPPSPAPKDQKSEDQKSEQKKSLWLQVARYSQLAFVLPAALVVGWLFGALLDKWFHTTWLYMAGIILGIVAGFVELIRTVSRDMQ
ncbi:MAG: AtpZ/AtpI family protein [Acidobacteriia bacterium]|nr:AtpZ/AtpI family protein [Terriglobia bacterium]